MIFSGKSNCLKRDKKPGSPRITMYNNIRSSGPLKLGTKEKNYRIWGMGPKIYVGIVTFLRY